MNILRIVMFTMLIVALGSTTSAQDPAGILDLNFNGTGKVIYDKDQFDVYQDVQIQPDGKIVAVGTSMSQTYQPYIEVTRFLENGAFDTSFGTDGHFNYSGNLETGAYKVIIKDDGKILVGGYSTNYAEWGMLLLQLNENGTLDQSFGNFGVDYLDLGPGEDVISAMVLQDNGKILIAGYSQDSEYRNAPVIARLSETGILDSSFGSDGIATIPVIETDNEFSAICIQSDGKILAAGHISNGSSWFSLLISRFDPDGVLDTVYGADGIVNMNLNSVDDEFFDMKLTEKDEAILSGFTVTQSDFYYHLLVMKFDTSGAVDLSFGNLGKVILGEVPYTFGDAMMLQTDGKILVAGCTGQLQPDNNDWALWRLNTDGSLDNSFGNNGLTTTEFFGNADEALGLALYENKIIVAGKIRNATNYLDFAVARYTNDTEYNVSLPEVKENLAFGVTPNPVRCSGILSLNYNLNQPEEMTLELISTAGTPVMISKLGKQAAGNHSFQLKLPPIPAAEYFLILKGSIFTSKTLKLIVAE
jgi:uncharacterized delta-60 repeat protein